MAQKRRRTVKESEEGQQSARRGQELGRDPRLRDVPGWRVKRSCLPTLRNFRHSLRTRDESPREPRIKRQSETG